MTALILVDFSKSNQWTLQAQCYVLKQHARFLFEQQDSKRVSWIENYNIAVSFSMYSLIFDAI